MEEEEEGEGEEEGPEPKREIAEEEEGEGELLVWGINIEWGIAGRALIGERVRTAGRGEESGEVSGEEIGEEGAGRLGGS